MNPFRSLMKPAIVFQPMPKDVVPRERIEALDVEFEKARANLNAMGIFDIKPLIVYRDQ